MDEGQAVYSWEKGFERDWEGVHEDSEGRLRTRDEEGRNQRERMGKRRLMGDGESLKRGMIRYLYLCIDLSKGMGEMDLRPSRQAATLRVVSDFIPSFFDQNPLGTYDSFRLSFCCCALMRNGVYLK